MLEMNVTTTTAKELTIHEPALQVITKTVLPKILEFMPEATMRYQSI